jgi:23S rRNA (uracil1939-C5)-methyltransferase
MDYSAQLVWKRQSVVDNLKRIGKLQVAGEDEQADGGIVVHPTVGMDNPWRYRNKAAVPIGAADDGQLIAGFYARGTHRIIDMDDCLIQHDRNDEVVRVVKKVAHELRIQPYNEESGQGVLRHVMARTGVVSGEVMVVLVTNGKRLPRQPEWIEHLRAQIPGLKSIVQNVNEKATNAIFGDETRVLWGSEVIYDELDDIRFAISARSFYQVNPAQTISLYRKAVEYAALTGKERVIDAYCGIGTISLFLARQAGHVYGIEIVPEAIADARRNAELNGIESVSFEAGPAEVVMPRWRKEGIEADVIVVDPPRKGCDPALLDTILALKPERVVYVSCNPSTLARDLRVLEDGGYRTVEVTPVDMFPHTVHVESCALLVRS